LYVATIGIFDGVHKGHQYILKNALELSQNLKLTPLIIMFKYPAEKYIGGFEGLILPSWRRKEICEKMGFKVLIKDLQEVWGVPHQEYLDNLIKMRVKGFVCGEDFTFGKDAHGNVDYLQTVGRNKGLVVKVLNDLKKYGNRVSSSSIKREIRLGNIPNANEMLGRPWTLEGMVYEDRHLGFKLGFPTANIDISEREEILLPKYGVYLVKGQIKGQSGTLWGLMNVGLRPTFEEEKKEPKVEVYFLDFFGDLYGNYVILDVLEFIREEVKFENEKQLIRAMEKDEDYARKIIQNHYL
jgi:riboflavin kinase/FMN adenylyltransferase